ncbi:PucR family transcriptional regulator [Fundicoccus culcitae]|uniref:Helix-turn-helix domain-containing protein n=1 Tax=Fundicoccus culcitae TaxID=2969821 RepID=A0ABY5P3V9_9LACT|nr:helix-turn-helix domain-containing protein [Fundicoccus culcitae]UUX33372.1 helix-turn-helix domain-containing protein [Fundicoccus culcitae]
MRLNLNIIYDELSDYDCQIIASENLDLNLRNVCYLPLEPEKLQSEYLYLTTAEKINEYGNINESISLLCLGEPKFDIRNNKLNVIFFNENLSEQSVFEKLLKIFEKYEDWEKSILLSMANNENLQTIFDISTSMLINPIALCDRYNTVVVKSKTFPEDVQGSPWKEAFEKGYVTDDVMENEEYFELNRLVAENNTPILFTSHLTFPGQIQMAARIPREGVPFGYLVSTDFNGDFTKGQLSIIYFIQDILNLALKNNYSMISGEQDLSTFFIENIIKGYDMGERSIAYLLQQWSWKVDDEYSLLVFYPIDDKVLDKSILNMLKNRIKGLSKSSFVFSYDNSIIAIFHNNNKESIAKDYSEQLQGILEITNLHCAVSMNFHNFKYIKYAYQQCGIIRNFSNLNQRIHTFDEVYTDYFLSILEEQTDLASMCNPIILNLYESDKNGKDFIQSLQAYLVHGRSMTAAANALFIHRNTLIFRLRKLEELLNLDLKTVNENTALMLYVSCLVATNKYNQQKVHN